MWLSQHYSTGEVLGSLYPISQINYTAHLISILRTQYQTHQKRSASDLYPKTEGFY